MAQSQAVSRRSQNAPTFHQSLKKYIDEFVDLVYLTCRRFPPDELYGATSQLKRAVLSIPLNYHEGHGRFTDKSRVQFIRISFGSLKECLYLIDFSYRQKFISEEQMQLLKKKGQVIYSMFWGILRPR